MATLLPHGSPAVILPFYAPAPGATARVVVGDAVTMARLFGNGTDIPFTFGQPFAEGDLVPGDALIGRTVAGEIALQVDVKATHNDGTIRHAIISGRIPEVVGSRDMWLIRAVPGEVEASPSISDADDYSVVLVDTGVEYTAKPGRTTPIHWLAGPVAQEFIYNVPFVDAAGTEHTAMTAQFCVRDYGVDTKIDVTLEHTKAYTTNGMWTSQPTAANPDPQPFPVHVDVKYDVKIYVAGETRYEQAGLTHFPMSRWKKTFWRSADPALHVQHFMPYLMETKAVSSYDMRVVVNETYLEGLAKELVSGIFGPMKTGRFPAAFGGTGGRPDIGLMPDAYAAYLLTGDKRAYDVTLASGDMGGSFPIHRRDDSGGEAHGQPLDVIHFPRATEVGTKGDSLNRATGRYEKMPTIKSSCKLDPDQSHQPDFPYLPYLLTGDYFYLEEMKFWTNWNIFSQNPGYRGSSRAVMTLGQVRGQAWTLRGMAQCAAMVPDADPQKSAFMYWLMNTAEHLDTNYATPGARLYSPLGFTISDYAVVYQDGTSISPWQDDFQMASWVHAYELTGLPALKRLVKWKANSPLGRMTAPGYCWIDATTYTIKVRDVRGGTEFYQTFADAYEKTFEGTPMLTTGCDTPERLAYLNAVRPMPSAPRVAGEMHGYADSKTGYPANMQPALAGAVDYADDIATADFAWQRFDGRAVQIKYGNGPQWAIIPRRYTPKVPMPDAPPPPGPKMETREISLTVGQWGRVDQCGPEWVGKLIENAWPPVL